MPPYGDKYYFDSETAEKVVRWIEKYCTHVKGELAEKPFILEPWQKDEIIRPMFGWKDKATGLRRYKRVFVFVPRKNGKSPLGSCLALYLLSADGEKGAEIYIAASDRNQAKIIHDDSKQMIRQNKDLALRIQSYQYSIVYEKTASSFKVLSADVKRQHGKNSHAVIFDELHTQPNRDLWDVLATSFGARRQPLLIAFTTAGFDRQTICYEQYEYAKKVRDGIIEDEHFLPVIYESDESDDIQSEQTWQKANPNYGISLKTEYVSQEAKRAIDEPSYENTFRRLQLNQWTASDVRWISDSLWMKGNKPVPLDFLKGKECTIGLDLSTVRDISAAVCDFKIEKKHFILPFFFCPKLTITERSKIINYDVWAKKGLIFETPGNSIDYDYIKLKLIELKGTYKIKKIKYDPWRAEQLIPQLIDLGFNCEEMRQGFQSMSNPTKEVEALLLNEELIHAGNPVMRWMCSNVMITHDPAGNIKIAKDKSIEKVDGMVAMVMAIDGWLKPDEKESIYNDLNKRPAGVRRL